MALAARNLMKLIPIPVDRLDMMIGKQVLIGFSIYADKRSWQWVLHAVDSEYEFATVIDSETDEYKCVHISDLYYTWADDLAIDYMAEPAIDRAIAFN